MILILRFQKTKEKINIASDDTDELVGARTKKINARLKSFEELSAAETKFLLDANNEIDSIEEN